MITGMETQLLTLVRHAKSSWKTADQRDHDRPLNKRGIRDAPIMAQRLLDKHCVPDLILCSSAVRTQQTARYFLDTLGLGDAQLWVEPKLYLCSPETILQEVAVAEQGHSHVMVIAHNPGHCRQAMPTLGVRHFACNSLSHIPLHTLSRESHTANTTAGNSVKLVFQDMPKNPDYG